MSGLGRTHPDRVRGNWVPEGYAHQPDLDFPEGDGVIETWTAADGSKVMLAFGDQDVVQAVRRYDPTGAPGGGRDPATILLTAEEVVYYLDYRLDGELHRDDGPALYRWSKSGAPSEERWFSFGTEIGDDGPSGVTFDHAGEVTTRSWCFYGHRHTFPRKWTSGRHPEIDAFFTAGIELGLTSLADLEAMWVDGVRTKEGLRALLDGAPLDWAVAFEAGKVDA